MEGGSGRFTNATGSGAFSGQADLVTATGSYAMGGIVHYKASDVES